MRLLRSPYRESRRHHAIGLHQPYSVSPVLDLHVPRSGLIGCFLSLSSIPMSRLTTIVIVYMISSSIGRRTRVYETAVGAYIVMSIGAITRMLRQFSSCLNICSHHSCKVQHAWITSGSQPWKRSQYCIRISYRTVGGIVSMFIGRALESPGWRGAVVCGC
jgi:hypothetical protein